MKLASPLPLVAICLTMFGFGFLMVPLYDVFCEVTGINGKTADQAVDSSRQFHTTERAVTIQFIANRNANLNWPFRPVKEQLKVRVGERHQIEFHLTNPSGQAVVAQAVPSVAPSSAAAYLHKVACFCFEQQHLTPGQHVKMPLVFVIDPELPEHISKLTLSYTLFDITPSPIEEKRSAI